MPIAHIRQKKKKPTYNGVTVTLPNNNEHQYVADQTVC